MIYDVHQTTIYHYASPVAYSRHVLRLTPIDRPGQRVHATALDIDPLPIGRREGHDFFGNRMTWIELDQPHDTLSVRVAARVAVKSEAPPRARSTPQWEAIRVALAYGRTGIFGAIMLGFGRALGETMAVTMVIGNNPTVSLSLFAPQYTMAAVIANEFTEAADDLYLNALVEIGLVLFAITLVINMCSRLLIMSMTRSRRPKALDEAPVLPEPKAA